MRFANDRPVFDFIVRYKTANDGLSPTYREIKTACGVSSESVVASILRRLEERDGLIELVPGRAGIKVVGGVWKYRREMRRNDINQT